MEICKTPGGAVYSARPQSALSIGPSYLPYFCQNCWQFSFVNMNIYRSNFILIYNSTLIGHVSNFWQIRIFCIVLFFVADPYPHPHGSAWFCSPGSSSGIRIPNADSRFGSGPKSSYVKITAEILITNTIINIMWYKIFKHFVAFQKSVYFKSTVQLEFSSVFWQRPRPE